ncbi:MAG TPA: hypothetical protein VIA02_08530 [Candidatus Limnocylindria bacterium]|jgi:anti-sigma factor RsiW
MRPSCARVTREVIEFFRFGDLDTRSAPHLDHLAVCADCRAEVGLDRELVVQLQRALRARVDGHAPSPGAWLEIRRRALQPEVPTWRARLLPVLRLAPIGATAVVLLALTAPSDLASFRVSPGLAAREPIIRQIQAAPDNDAVDPYQGRWWLRLVPAPDPEAPATGPVPTADPWEPVAVKVERSSGAIR